MNYIQITFERTTVNAVANAIIEAGGNPIDSPQPGCVVASVPRQMTAGQISDLIWALNDGAFCEVEDLDYDEIEHLL